MQRFFELKKSKNGIFTYYTYDHDQACITSHIQWGVGKIQSKITADIPNTAINKISTATLICLNKNRSLKRPASLRQSISSIIL